MQVFRIIYARDTQSALLCPIHWETISTEINSFGSKIIFFSRHKLLKLSTGIIIAYGYIVFIIECFKKQTIFIYSFLILFLNLFLEHLFSSKLFPKSKCKKLKQFRD